MTTELVEAFQYPDEATEIYCNARLCAILTEKQNVISSLARIGGHLQDVKNRLPHGYYTPWLEAHGLNLERARRYRILYRELKDHPELLQFDITSALEYAGLRSPVRAVVLEKRAFTCNEFRRVSWGATMREHLADDALDPERRCGDVYHAIQEAQCDPVLEPAARELYEENRDRFARLHDEPPPVVDMWTLPSKPVTSNNGHRLISEDRGYRLCQWDGECLNIIAPIEAIVTSGNGGVPLVAFMKVNGGAGDRAVQMRFMEAGCQATHVKRHKGVL